MTLRAIHARCRYRWYQLMWPFKQIGFWLARRRLRNAYKALLRGQFTAQYTDDNA